MGLATDPNQWHTIPVRDYCKPMSTSKMMTAWLQQYRGLCKQGLRNPDPQQQFLDDLGRFLTEICNEGAKYILGWDANTPYDHDDIQDFFKPMKWLTLSLISMMNVLLCTLKALLKLISSQLADTLLHTPPKPIS
jgi:hypothetical protein